MQDLCLFFNVSNNIYRDNLELNVLEHPDDNTLVFELIHCDASFVNALRRILLAEVPTVALEQIYMWNNSSIIHDEVLAHRLGLIPLDIDPRLLEDLEDADEITDRNTVVFRLNVTCPKQPPTAKQSIHHRTKKPNEDLDDATADDVVHPHPDLEAAAAEATASTQHRNGLQYPADRPFTQHVYARDLVWCPQGDQATDLEHRPPKALYPDILIAKLRPGQTIELEAHGRRGIGKDHAKFSPVATASYRLLPRIELLHDVYDALAEELVHVYEPGVFALVPTNPTVDPPGTRVKAQLVNPYACTMSRNYMRVPALKDAIHMSRVSDHYIFSVESVGAYKASVLVAEALKVLQRKCERLVTFIDEHSSTGQPPHATSYENEDDVPMQTEE
jgi:DNA-directed RNA polymerase I and III subunit RPAC1